ncbi:HU family DNA-binding protein [Histidinibacterium aquaticum]|uniref:DNA-binding protein n=1 Tax=Histidinibacterium aquaticum TaxID=2613962 RepID=A0A5J5GKV3_9RHOB|nr:HU family DNA-binding protein [Histidinibacterium aquaticum]KAA9008956.1 DNA-binding protein [Histidinibacterium aquaticum]
MADRSAPDDSPETEPTTTVVTEQTVVVGPELKKKAFIDRVVDRCGGKKRDVKPAVEAALEVLGEAIANGEELNLPPLGKVKINRQKEVANAHVYVCKLRRPKTMTAALADSPLAEDGEEG